MNNQALALELSFINDQTRALNIQLEEFRRQTRTVDRRISYLEYIGGICHFDFSELNNVYPNPRFLKDIVSLFSLYPDASFYTKSRYEYEDVYSRVKESDYNINKILIPTL